MFSPGSMHSHARDVAHLFYGHELKGKVVRTLVAGETVFSDGEVVGPKGAGRYITPAFRP